MSSKRYLLILACGLLISLLSAQNSLVSSQNLRWLDGDQSTFAFSSRNNYFTPLISGVFLEINDDLEWFDRFAENRNTKFNNRFNLACYYPGPNLKLGAAYLGHFYDGAELIFINQDFIASPWAQYEKKALHQANIDASYRISVIELGAELNLRLLQADPHQLFGDPVELQDLLFDNYSTASLSVTPLSGMDIHFAYDYKQHPLDEGFTGSSKDFDYDIMTMGIGYEKELNLQSHLALKFDYQNRKWDDLAPELKNQVITELRVGHHFNPDIYAFCSYINRSCFDDPTEQIWLMANYARAQLQYNFPRDFSARSHIALGAKLRPANKDAFHPNTSAYFAEAEYQVLPHCYLMAAVNIAPEIQNEYRGRISYELGSIGDLHLEYIGRQSQRAGFPDDLQNSLAIGLEKGLF